MYSFYEAEDKEFLTTEALYLNAQKRKNMDKQYLSDSHMCVMVMSVALFQPLRSFVRQFVCYISQRVRMRASGQCEAVVSSLSDCLEQAVRHFGATVERGWGNSRGERIMAPYAHLSTRPSFFTLWLFVTGSHLTPPNFLLTRPPNRSIFRCLCSFHTIYHIVEKNNKKI